MSKSGKSFHRVQKKPNSLAVKCSMVNKFVFPPAPHVVTILIISWPDVHLVHNGTQFYVRGCAICRDMHTLLMLNNLQTFQAQHLLSKTADFCPSCKVPSHPTPTLSQRALIASLSRLINDIGCREHFYSNDKIVFHIFDVAARSLLGAIF